MSNNINNRNGMSYMGNDIVPLSLNYFQLSPNNYSNQWNSYNNNFWSGQSLDPIYNYAIQNLLLLKPASTTTNLAQHNNNLQYAKMQVKLFSGINNASLNEYTQYIANKKREEEAYNNAIKNKSEILDPFLQYVYDNYLDGTVYDLTNYAGLYTEKDGNERLAKLNEKYKGLESEKKWILGVYKALSKAEKLLGQYNKIDFTDLEDALSTEEGYLEMMAPYTKAIKEKLDPNYDPLRVDNVREGLLNYLMNSGFGAGDEITDKLMLAIVDDKSLTDEEKDKYIKEVLSLRGLDNYQIVTRFPDAANLLIREKIVLNYQNLILAYKDEMDSLTKLEIINNRIARKFFPFIDIDNLDNYGFALDARELAKNRHLKEIFNLEESGDFKKVKNSKVDIDKDKEEIDGGRIKKLVMTAGEGHFSTEGVIGEFLDRIDELNDFINTIEDSNSIAAIKNNVSEEELKKLAALADLTFEQLYGDYNHHKEDILDESSQLGEEERDLEKVKLYLTYCLDAERMGYPAASKRLAERLLKLKADSYGWVGGFLKGVGFGVYNFASTAVATGAKLSGVVSDQLNPIAAMYHTEESIRALATGDSENLDTFSNSYINTLEGGLVNWAEDLESTGMWLPSSLNASKYGKQYTLEEISNLLSLGILADPNSLAFKNMTPEQLKAALKELEAYKTGVVRKDLGETWMKPVLAPDRLISMESGVADVTGVIGQTIAIAGETAALTKVGSMLSKTGAALRTTSSIAGTLNRTQKALNVTGAFLRASGEATKAISPYVMTAGLDFGYGLSEYRSSIVDVGSKIYNNPYVGLVYGYTDDYKKRADRYFSLHPDEMPKTPNELLVLAEVDRIYQECLKSGAFQEYKTGMFTDENTKATKEKLLKDIIRKSYLENYKYHTLADKDFREGQHIAANGAALTWALTMVPDGALTATLRSTLFVGAKNKAATKSIKTWLKNVISKDSRVSLGEESQLLESVLLQNGKYVAKAKAKEYSGKKLTKDLIAGGFISNYLLDVGVAAGTAKAMAEWNNYLSYKYDPELSRTIRSVFDDVMTKSVGALMDPLSFRDGILGAIAGPVTPHLSFGDALFSYKSADVKNLSTSGKIKALASESLNYLKLKAKGFRVLSVYSLVLELTNKVNTLRDNYAKQLTVWMNEGEGKAFLNNITNQRLIYKESTSSSPEDKLQSGVEQLVANAEFLMLLANAKFMRVKDLGSGKEVMQNPITSGTLDYIKLRSERGEVTVNDINVAINKARTRERQKLLLEILGHLEGSKDKTRSEEKRAEAKQIAEELMDNLGIDEYDVSNELSDIEKKHTLTAREITIMLDLEDLGITKYNPLTTKFTLNFSIEAAVEELNNVLKIAKEQLWAYEELVRQTNMADVALSEMGRFADPVFKNTYARINTVAQLCRRRYNNYIKALLEIQLGIRENLADLGISLETLLTPDTYGVITALYGNDFDLIGSRRNTVEDIIASREASIASLNNDINRLIKQKLELLKKTAKERAQEDNVNSEKYESEDKKKLISVEKELFNLRAKREALVEGAIMQETNSGVSDDQSSLLELKEERNILNLILRSENERIAALEKEGADIFPVDSVITTADLLRLDSANLLAMLMSYQKDVEKLNPAERMLTLKQFEAIRSLGEDNINGLLEIVSSKEYYKRKADELDRARMYGLENLDMFNMAINEAKYQQIEDIYGDFYKDFIKEKNIKSLEEFNTAYIEELERIDSKESGMTAEEKANRRIGLNSALRNNVYYKTYNKISAQYANVRGAVHRKALTDLDQNNPNGDPEKAERNKTILKLVDGALLYYMLRRSKSLSDINNLKNGGTLNTETNLLKSYLDSRNLDTEGIDLQNEVLNVLIGAAQKVLEERRKTNASLTGKSEGTKTKTNNNFGEKTPEEIRLDLAVALGTYLYSLNGIYALLKDLDLGNVINDIKSGKLNSLSVIDVVKEVVASIINSDIIEETAAEIYDKASLNSTSDLEVLRGSLAFKIKLRITPLINKDSRAPQLYAYMEQLKEDSPTTSGVTMLRALKNVIINLLDIDTIEDKEGLLYLHYSRLYDEYGIQDFVLANAENITRAGIDGDFNVHFLYNSSKDIRVQKLGKEGATDEEIYNNNEDSTVAVAVIINNEWSDTDKNNDKVITIDGQRYRIIGFLDNTGVEGNTSKVRDSIKNYKNNEEWQVLRDDLGNPYHSYVNKVNVSTLANTDGYLTGTDINSETGTINEDAIIRVGDIRAETTKTLLLGLTLKESSIFLGLNYEHTLGTQTLRITNFPNRKDTTLIIPEMALTPKDGDGLYISQLARNAEDNNGESYKEIAEFNSLTKAFTKSILTVVEYLNKRLSKNDNGEVEPLSDAERLELQKSINGEYQSGGNGYSLNIFYKSDLVEEGERLLSLRLYISLAEGLNYIVDIITREDGQTVMTISLAGTEEAGQTNFAVGEFIISDEGAKPETILKESGKFISNMADLLDVDSLSGKVTSLAKWLIFFGNFTNMASNRALKQSYQASILKLGLLQFAPLATKVSTSISNIYDTETDKAVEEGNHTVELEIAYKEDGEAVNGQKVVNLSNTFVTKVKNALSNTLFHYTKIYKQSRPSLPINLIYRAESFGSSASSKKGGKQKIAAPSAVMGNIVDKISECIFLGKEVKYTDAMKKVITQEEFNTLCSRISEGIDALRARGFVPVTTQLGCLDKEVAKYAINEMKNNPNRKKYMPLNFLDFLMVNEKGELAIIDVKSCKGDNIDTNHLFGYARLQNLYAKYVNQFLDGTDLEVTLICLFVVPLENYGNNCFLVKHDTLDSKKETVTRNTNGDGTAVGSVVGNTLIGLIHLRTMQDNLLNKELDEMRKSGKERYDRYAGTTTKKDTLLQPTDTLEIEITLLWVDDNQKFVDKTWYDASTQLIVKCILIDTNGITYEIIDDDGNSTGQETTKDIKVVEKWAEPEEIKKASAETPEDKALELDTKNCNPSGTGKGTRSGVRRNRFG